MCGHFNIDFNCKHCRDFYNACNKKLKIGSIEKVLVEKDKNGNVTDAELILKRDAVDEAFRDKPLHYVRSKFKYYHLLSSCAQQEAFTDKVDETVMRMRADAATIKSICAELKKMGFKRHRQTVRYII